MEGTLSENPLAELIREITAAALTGALRLAHERARVAIYFEAGRLVFATSNLRAHRLREVVKRNGLTEAHVAEFPARTPDEEIAAAMLETGLLKPETLAAIRVKQVSDVLRLALLWTDGHWTLDPRVRLADEVRVQVDVNRLLLECARHLPAGFVASRLEQAGNASVQAAKHTARDIMPAEASILLRASEPQTLNQLICLSVKDDGATLRAIYALSLSGLLASKDWPLALGPQKPGVATAAPAGLTKAKSAASIESTELADLEALFGRLELAQDHYEVLNVARLASSNEIKDAYHSLARRFHPDRFHQTEPQLRNRVESAFARIARAYETLSSQSARTDYDSRNTSKPPAARVQKPAPPQPEQNGKQAAERQRTDAARAETSFQHGLDALKRNRPDEAVRFLGEAAMLLPREARYRAHYGQALIRQPNTRRIAESELQAALSLEPENAGYRVILAELYKTLGLLKRAEGELERALAIDSNNEAARSLLLNLKSKGPKS